MNDPRKLQLQALGKYIRGQRELAHLSLREMAQLSRISNAYISQLERGLHEPSIGVLRALAASLGVSAEELLEAAGFNNDDEAPRPSGENATEAAIRADAALTESQKQALLGVYRSFVPEPPSPRDPE